MVCCASRCYSEGRAVAAVCVGSRGGRWVRSAVRSTSEARPAAMAGTAERAVKQHGAREGLWDVNVACTAG